MHGGKPSRFLSVWDATADRQLLFVPLLCVVLQVEGEHNAARLGGLHVWHLAALAPAAALPFPAAVAPRPAAPPCVSAAWSGLLFRSLQATTFRALHTLGAL